MTVCVMCSGWANIGQDAPPCRSKGRRQRGPNRAGHRPPLRYHAVMLLRLSGACAWSPWPLVPVAPQALGIPLHQPSAGGAQAKRTGATVPEHLQEPGGCSTNRCHDARRMWKVMEGEGGESKAWSGQSATNPCAMCSNGRLLAVSLLPHPGQPRARPAAPCRGSAVRPCAASRVAWCLDPPE